jgi:hypothetical protein
MDDAPDSGTLVYEVAALAGRRLDAPGPTARDLPEHRRTNGANDDEGRRRPHHHRAVLSARRAYLIAKVRDASVAGRKIFLKDEIAALDWTLAVLGPLVEALRAEDQTADRQARRRHFSEHPTPPRERLSIDTLGETEAARGRMT